MFKKRKLLTIAVIFTIIGLIIGLGISSNFNLQSNGYTSNAEISKEAIDILSKTNEAITEVVAAVKPSVVNISSTKTVKTHGFSPFFDDPFFRRFFGDEFRFFEKPREHKQYGLGSGVIVDKDGYILTNNHVIKGADEIKVKLPDKREFKGKVIGTDPKTDIAVIKIDTKNLPIIKFGDSDKLRVGETVLAIGNPFGLTQTVTSGIVSATGRANVGIADYEDFIQTDAPINPGNSGGALVNIKGELIGINTAIFSTTGGYQGIGFAIPSNMAKVVMESLVHEGKVVRGWLGVSIQSLTPDLSKHFNVKDGKGCLVTDIIENSPAEKSGIKRDDIIIEFDGKEIEDPTDLRNRVAGTVPGREVEIKFLRDGKIKSVKVEISELPSEMEKLPGEFDNLLKGIHVQNLTSMIRKNLQVPKRINGVLISDIEDGSPAEGVLSKNDLILAINKKEIKNMDDYKVLVSKIKADEDILLLIYRNGSTIYITLSSR
ncbi:MAG: DegQ family serine endoprotease [Nitrospirota bacterium]